MLIVDTALKARAASGRPVQVAMYGAGYMARGITTQIVRYTPGLRLAVICNAIGMTRNCYTRVGDPTDWIGTAWDVDYCWRVQLAGMKLTYVPEALVHYRLRDTAEGRFKQARTWGRGHVKLHIRYGMKPWWRYLAFSLYRLVRAGFLLVFGTLAGKRPYAYWVFDWGFARGQLEAFPTLLRAQLKRVPPEKNILAGQQPEGPQTYIGIPDA